MAFTPINVDANANGGYFSMQLAAGEENLDIFAIFGLHADGGALDLRQLRSHFRTVMMPHAFERQGAGSAPTQGPEIPTWSQMNIAKGIMFKADDDRSLARLQAT